LIGYDWDTGKIFWKIEHKYVVCQGVCYDNNVLRATCGSVVAKITPHRVFVRKIEGRYNAQTHGIHLIDRDTYGVADIGNARVIIYSRETDQVVNYLCSVSHWGNPLPEDVLHMNDFVATPFGILATAFNHRPWRSVRERISVERWFNLDGDGRETGERVVGTGLTHPHTLHYIDPYVYVLSASKSLFHIFELNPSSQTLVEKTRIRIADSFWLRGSCCIGGQYDNTWYFGGIRSKYLLDVNNRQKQGDLSIFRMSKMFQIEEKKVGINGSIFDVLPWKDNVMNPIVQYYERVKQDRK